MFYFINWREWFILLFIIFLCFVATKTDIRNDPTEDTITTAEGKKMRDKIKAIKYFECSAKTGVGLDEIFVEAVRSSVNKHHKKRVVHCVTL